MAKKSIMFRLDPELKFYGKQLAAKEKRSFNNLIEVILQDKIIEAIHSGVEFETFIPEGGEVVGNGVDSELQKVFKDFVG